MSILTRISFLLLLHSYALAADNSFQRLFATGEAQRIAGQYQLALASLTAAYDATLEPLQSARAAGAIGHTHYLMGHSIQAEDGLKQAVTASELPTQERARYANILGSLYAEHGQIDTANFYYRQALTWGAPDLVLTMSVRLNQSRLLPETRRLAELQILAGEIAHLPESTERTRLLLYLGEQARSLNDPAALPIAYTALNQARINAAQQAELRSLIESALGLAQLYAAQGRTTEAIGLLQAALQYAQSDQDQNADLLLLLEWQQGKLLQQAKAWDSALAAYRRAVQHLEAIRSDIPVTYQNGRSSFRDTLAPVYLDLADLLLYRSRQAATNEQQSLLREAQDTLELLKQTEMEDFLGERCLVQRVRSNRVQIAADVAVLYPILLPDRLELLLELSGVLHQYTLAVPSAALENQAQTMALHLRAGSSQYRAAATKLYTWLIAPIAADLRAQGIHTLVAIPDGALRLIPLAALYDGKEFLIENYALAISPALTLLTGRPSVTPGYKTLLAGMSEPGAVVTKLPTDLLAALLGAIGTERGLHTNRGLPRQRSVASTLDQSAGTNHAITRQVMDDPNLQNSLKQALSLPGVEQEIDQLGAQLDNKRLFNKTFTIERFSQQLRDYPYQFIHIASHGVFGGDAANTFVMAYDDIIPIDALSDLLQAPNRRQAPLELLTLSACETAEGDDRAPLGLSGMALRARSRSAIGSLWPINDAAAQLLMTAFYRYLMEPGVGKAEALRRAQLDLLHQTETHDPALWSPFVLVGSWL